MDYIACQGPLSMGFSRQEYWSGLPFPSPGDLPNPGIKPGSPVLQTDSLLTELWGKPFCLSKRLCQSDCLTPHIWIVHILTNIGYYLCLKTFDKLMDRICIWLFTLWFFNCKQAWSCFFLPFKSFFYKLIFQIPTPVLLPGKSHGWRSLVGCSPWGCEQSDTTEWLHFYFSLSCIGEGNGNPLQCSCLENPRDGATWWAAVYGVVQSRTRLKWLSSSSSSHSSGAFLHWVVGCLYIFWRLRFVRSVVSNCSPPGSSVHGIFQAKVLEWGAIAFSIVSMCFSLFLLMGINLFPEKLCRS